MVKFDVVVHKSLLAHGPCTHHKIKWLSADQLREGFVVCYSMGLATGISLQLAQHEHCRVQENPQLLDWSLMFLALEPFSSCASHNDGVVRVIIL
jgi:hypothetical protein